MRFVCVYDTERTQKMNGAGSGARTAERLYVPLAGLVRRERGRRRAARTAWDFSARELFRGGRA